MIRGKSCEKCRKWYPLWMFKKDTRKFQLKIALGKVRNCKICNWKDSREAVVRYRDNKFQIVKLSFLERVKELFQ